MLLVSALLPAVAFGVSSTRVPLDFKYDACEQYCEGENPHAFTFTKYACPEGGERADQGGFLPDECSEGNIREITYAGSCSDYSLTECERPAQKARGCEVGELFGETICVNRRTTTVEEAMIMCGKQKIVELEDGTLWLAPEYKFRLAAQKCRDGHADGSGWQGDDTGTSPDPDATADDVDYTECLTQAYNDCVASEPISDRCVRAREEDDQNFWCTFCHDCVNGKSESTCFTNREIYTKAAQSCFSDDGKSGYLGCLDNARDIYDKEVLEREAVCSETFVIDKGSLPCRQGFGYVSCCCMVKGTLIEHPVDSIHTCQDRASVAQCDTWKSHNFCVEGHKYYESMKDNCRSTCGLCTADDAAPTSGGCPPATGHVASDCDCIEGKVLDDFVDYNLKMISINDPDLCDAMSGNYKKGSCRPAKKVNQVKCDNASNDMDACMALGCDMVWGTNPDGSTAAFECDGVPTAIL